MWRTPYELVQGFDSKIIHDLRFYNGLVEYLIDLSESIDGTQVSASALIDVSKLTRNSRVSVVSGSVNSDPNTLPDANWYQVAYNRFPLPAGRIFAFFGVTGYGTNITLREVTGVTTDISAVVRAAGSSDRWFMDYIDPAFTIDVAANYYEVIITNPGADHFGQWHVLFSQDL